jgi:hypothetical protein
MRNNYLSEFPRFDFDIPTLPKGFVDVSWHNNVSPSFERKLTEETFVTLWVDYADEDRRECGGKQFLLTILPNDDLCNDVEVLLETNSWEEVLSKVNQIFGE